jgi:hypothetical protein
MDANKHTESLAGHKARRYTDAAKRAADTVLAARNGAQQSQAQYAKMDDQYANTQQDYALAQTYNNNNNTAYNPNAYNY